MGLSLLSSFQLIDVLSAISAEIPHRLGSTPARVFLASTMRALVAAEFRKLPFQPLDLGEQTSLPLGGHAQQAGLLFAFLVGGGEFAF